MSEDLNNDPGNVQDNTEPAPETSADAQTPETGDDGLLGSDTKDDKADSPDDGLLGDDKQEGDNEGEDSKDETKEGAPEKYEAFTMPEGFEMNEESFSQFSGIGKDLNLPQDVMQKLIDFDINRQVDAEKAYVASVKAQQESDLKELKSEFGAKLPEFSLKAKKAYDTYFDKDLRQELADAGVNKSPKLLKALAKIGETISEDSFVKGDTGKKETFEKLTDIFPQPKVEGAK